MKRLGRGAGVRSLAAGGVVTLCLLTTPARSLAQNVDADGLIVESYLDGLEAPVAFEFIGPDELFVLQRDGDVLWFRDGRRIRRVLRLPVSRQGDRGGLGMALGADFATDGSVFVHYSARGPDGRWRENRVVRATFNGRRLVRPRTLLTFPHARGQSNDPTMNGGALRVGADGTLYGLVGGLGRVGDRVEQNGSGEGSSGVGAIFRLDPSGDVPADNPFGDESDEALRKWFAYGFRDGVGMTFDPVTGDLWFTEIGPGIYDEINHATAGMNGGWLRIAGPDSRDATYSDNGGIAWDAADLVMLPGSEYRDPVFSWAESIGVTALSFLDSHRYGTALRNDLVVGDRDGNLHLFDVARRPKLRQGLRLSGPLADRVADGEEESGSSHWGSGLGEIRDLKIGPDRLLYVLDGAGGRLWRVVPEVAPTARYRVTFNSTWSAATHPDPGFPPDPHLSGLVGGTHDSTVAFWAPGGLATEAIRRMAERGTQILLEREVLEAAASGTAENVLSGGGIARSPGSTSLEFEISRSFPLVTLVSMIAPSPDWFTGVHDLSLLSGGAWIESLSVDLFPYDAGTDSDVTFTSPDQETLPHEPVALIPGAPFAAGTPIGQFVFERIR